jgi:hypothetical protein
MKPNLEVAISQGRRSTTRRLDHEANYEEKGRMTTDQDKHPLTDQHPITKSLKEVDPPLDSTEGIEAYFAATHKTDGPILQRHAFAIVIEFPGGQREPVEISPRLSLREETNNQRGNLGAVLTIFEWLKKNHAQANEVVVHTSEKFIVENLDASAKDKTKRSKLRDLYDKYQVLREELPGPTFMKCSKNHPRRQRALDLANAKLRQVFPPIDP